MNIKFYGMEKQKLWNDTITSFLLVVQEIEDCLHVSSHHEAS